MYMYMYMHMHRSTSSLGNLDCLKHNYAISSFFLPVTQDT